MGIEDRYFRYLFILLVVSYFLMNIFGFCYSDFKFYNENEIIDKIIEIELKENRGDLLNGIHTVGDFKEKYRNCCEINLSKIDYNILFILFGAGRWDVYISYISYKAKKYKSSIAIYRVDCCARIGNVMVDF